MANSNSTDITFKDAWCNKTLTKHDKDAVHNQQVRRSRGAEMNMELPPQELNNL